MKRRTNQPRKSGRKGGPQVAKIAAPVRRNVQPVAPKLGPKGCKSRQPHIAQHLFGLPLRGDVSVDAFPPRHRMAAKLRRASVMVTHGG